eukprot:6214701-Pleurochrysis_carterae.AAC.1
MQCTFDSHSGLRGGSTMYAQSPASNATIGERSTYLCRGPSFPDSRTGQSTSRTQCSTCLWWAPRSTESRRSRPRSARVRGTRIGRGDPAAGRSRGAPLKRQLAGNQPDPRDQLGGGGTKICDERRKGERRSSCPGRIRASVAMHGRRAPRPLGSSE